MRLVRTKNALLSLLLLTATAGVAHAYTFPERWNTGPGGSQNNRSETRRVADFNGDGRAEIAEVLPAGAHTVALNIFNVAGERLYTSPPFSPAGTFEIRLEDVNQNGTPDYVIRGPITAGSVAKYAVYGFDSGFALLDSLTTPQTTTQWFHAQLEPDLPLELVVVTSSGNVGQVRLHMFGADGFATEIQPGGPTCSGAPFAEAYDLNANGLEELYVSYCGQIFMYASDPAVAGASSVGARAASLALAAPWPNPTSGSATLRFRLPGDSPAVVRIHDAAGRRVRKMSLPQLPAGEHEVTWDGRDDARASVAPGVYWMELEAAGVTQARQVVRLH